MLSKDIFREDYCMKYFPKTDITKFEKDLFST